MDYNLDRDESRNTHLDWVRWIAIWLVVGVHAVEAVRLSSSDRTREQSDVLRMFQINLLQIGMPIFFSVAGRAAVLTKKNSNFLTFSISKIRRLILPIIPAVFLFLTPAIYLCRKKHPSVPFIAKRTDNFFDFLSVWTTVFKVVGLDWLWFLPCLFFISLLNYPLLIVCRRNHHTPEYKQLQSELTAEGLRTFQTIELESGMKGSWESSGESTRPSNNSTRPSNNMCSAVSSTDEGDGRIVTRSDTISYDSPDVNFSNDDEDLKDGSRTSRWSFCLQIFSYFVLLFVLAMILNLTISIPFTATSVIISIFIAPILGVVVSNHSVIFEQLLLPCLCPVVSLLLILVRRMTLEVWKQQMIISNDFGLQCFSFFFYTIFFIHGILSESVVSRSKPHPKISSISNLLSPVKMILVVALIANGFGGTLRDQTTNSWAYPLFEPQYKAGSYIIGSWCLMWVYLRLSKFLLDQRFNDNWFKNTTESTMIVYLSHGLFVQCGAASLSDGLPFQLALFVILLFTICGTATLYVLYKWALRMISQYLKI